MKHPGLIIVAFFIVGLITGKFIFIPPFIIYISIAMIIGFYFISSSRFTDTRGKSSYRASTTGFLLFLALALLGIRLQNYADEEQDLAEETMRKVQDEKEVALRGRVCGIPDYRDRSVLITLDSVEIIRGDTNLYVPGKCLLILAGQAKQEYIPGTVARGDNVSARGHLSAPATLKNPRAFNYVGYLGQKGIFSMMYVNFLRNIRIDPPEKGRSYINRMLLFVDTIRESARKKIFDSLRTDRAAVVYAILFGKSYGIAPLERQKFVESGLIHLFAVSGLHAGMIAFILYVTFTTVIGDLRYAVPGTIVGLLCYCAIVGFRAPVVRAVFMADVFFMSLLLQRRPISGLDALSTAAFVVLLINPRALLQADFQLSYVSVFALITLRPAIEQTFRLEKIRTGKYRRLKMRIKKFLLDPILLVFVVQLMLLPLLIRYYHRCSLIGFFSNVVAIPVTFFIICMGGLFLISSSLLLPLTPILAFLVSAGSAVLLCLSRISSSLPFASLHFNPLPWWATGVYYGMLLGGSYLVGFRTPIERLRGRARFLIVIASILVLFVWLKVFQTESGSLKVTILDVGQGDAIVAEFPNDSTMLIDGGRGDRIDMGERVVIPFLYAHGIEHLDIVVLTHPDADHLGGLVSTVSHVSTGMVVKGRTISYSETYRAFIDQVEKSNIPVTIVSCGDRIEGCAGIDVIVLNPDEEEGLSSNDESVVMRLSYDRVSFLLTGDAEMLAEMSMLSSGYTIESTVLKAGHHGSRESTNPAFLEEVKPLLVVFSCGVNNPYGHPHPEVIQRCAERAIKYYRTDFNGSISFMTDGANLEIMVEQ